VRTVTVSTECQNTEHDVVE